MVLAETICWLTSQKKMLSRCQCFFSLMALAYIETCIEPSKAFTSSRNIFRMIFALSGEILYSLLLVPLGQILPTSSNASIIPVSWTPEWKLRSGARRLLFAVLLLLFSEICHPSKSYPVVSPTRLINHADTALYPTKIEQILTLISSNLGDMESKCSLTLQELESRR